MTHLEIVITWCYRKLFYISSLKLGRDLIIDNFVLSALKFGGDLTIENCAGKLSVVFWREHARI